MADLVDFTIANPGSGDEAVIFVTSDPTLNKLVFTIVFHGDAPVTFKGGAPVEESKITPQGPTSFYFTVSSVLTPAEFAAMTVECPAGWQAENLNSWALTPVDDLTVNPGDSFEFQLGNITADGQPGPGSFNIDNWNIPGVVDNGTQLRLSLENLPDKHKRLADFMPISIKGGDTVYIDFDDKGEMPPNTLILRLDNTSNAPLVPSGLPWPNTPVFYLTFVTAGSTPGYGALTTKDRMSDITVSLAADYGTDWTIQDHTQEDPPHWAIFPKSHEILGTGANAIVEFKIAGIVTDFAPGSTNLYLQSSFIPGYDDGCQAWPIVKATPVTFTQQLRASPASGIFYGQPVTLSWATVSATSCSIDPAINGSNSVPTSSDGIVIRPKAPVRYVLTAQGEPGPIESTIDVIPIPKDWKSQAGAGIWDTMGRPVILPDYNQRLWFLAGGPGDLTSYVFSSTDGFDWDFVTDTAGYAPRGDAAGCVFNGKLWLLGGKTRNGVVNEIWNSTDGESWTQVQAGNHWSPRSQLGCASFAGKIWIAGGKDANGTLLGDVWNSSDGINWNQVTATANWPARAAMGMTVFNGLLCVLAGESANGPLADAWQSADGVNWDELGNIVNWQRRSSPNVNVVGGKLYVIGGTDAFGNMISDNNVLNPDGSWAIRAGPGWSGDTLNLGSASFLGAQWFAGGTVGGSANKTVWGYGGQ